jgi:hypothetical protein
MSWSFSSSCLTRRQTGSSTRLCITWIALITPWIARRITTTRPFRAPETGDEPKDVDAPEIADKRNTTDHPVVRKTNSGSIIRVSPSGRSLRPGEHSPVQHVRIAQLVDKDNVILSRVRFVNQIVKVKGMIRNIRKQKKTAFIELTDGSHVLSIQVIVNPDIAAPYVLG